MNIPTKRMECFYDEKNPCDLQFVCFFRRIKQQCCHRTFCNSRFAVERCYKIAIENTAFFTYFILSLWPIFYFVLLKIQLNLWNTVHNVHCPVEWFAFFNKNVKWIENIFFFNFSTVKAHHKTLSKWAKIH